MKRFIWGLAAGILLLIVCSTLKMERGLSPTHKKFYDHVWLIMETRVPKDIDPKQPYERVYFLKLTPEQKDKYIKLFWEMREVDAEKEYQFRTELATKAFRGEGIDGEKTDRGFILLLCGQPDYLECVDQNGDYYNAGEEEWGYAEQAERRWFQKWIYWYGQGFFRQLVPVWFEYDKTRTWHYIPSTDSQQKSFIDYCRWRLGPTPEGWDLWRKQ